MIHCHLVFVANLAENSLTLVNLDLVLQDAIVLEWAMTCYRVRDNGHYVKGVEFSVFLAIEPGDPRLPPDTLGGLHNPQRWIKVVQYTGATIASQKK